MDQKMKSHIHLNLIWGMQAIADFMGVSRIVAYKMAYSGEIPARQVGTRWVAKRTDLEAFFSQASHAKRRARV
jgi:excisionase family DNA binding protein